MSRYSETEITDSLSCQHIIEHFGIGRFVNPINPLGHISGFENIVKLLERNVLLCIIFPITSDST